MIDLQNPQCVHRDGWFKFWQPAYREHEPEQAMLYFPVKLESGDVRENEFVAADGWPVVALLCRHCRQPYLERIGHYGYRRFWSPHSELDMTLEEARAALMKGFAIWRMRNHQHEGPPDDCWVCNTDMFDLVAPAYIFGQDKVR